LVDWGANPHHHHPGAAVASLVTPIEEISVMGLGRGMLLWLLGIPLPIVLLLALFWR
jgi:hypothetical protein